MGGTTVAPPIRLVLAGRDAIVLACLERLFALEGDFTVFVCRGEAEVVLDTLHARRPDVLLVDVSPAASQSVDLVREMKSAALPTRVVFLTEPLTKAELAAAVRLGVSGIVPKDVAPDALAQCIRKVHTGGIWLRPGGSPHPEKEGPNAPDNVRIELTPREKEIVELIGEGLGNREIAGRLLLREATVKTHLHKIYGKLRLRDRLQLSLYSREHPPRQRP